MENSVPINLDWVGERFKCSLPVVFKELEQGIRDDIEQVKALFPDDPAEYVLTPGRNRFSVALISDPMTSLISDQIGFELTKDHINVNGTNGVAFKAELTLNREGRCKLRLEGEELELWQVRRMALEKLIFGA